MGVGVKLPAANRKMKNKKMPLGNFHVQLFLVIPHYLKLTKTASTDVGVVFVRPA
jgi:hypothetical protein